MHLLDLLCLERLEAERIVSVNIRVCMCVSMSVLVKKMKHQAMKAVDNGKGAHMAMELFIPVSLT